jgi:circadian clock protein KaiC
MIRDSIHHQMKSAVVIIPTKLERLFTGVKGLDDLLSGGVPKNSVILVTGRPGAGKTLLGAHFLYEGTSAGERGIYVSFGEGKEQFLSNMDSLGFPLRRAVDSGMLEYIDLATVSTDGVKDAIDLVVSHVESFKAKRLVIDSFTSLAQAFEKLIDARVMLHVAIGKVIRNEGCTTMLLAEMPYGENRIGLGIEEFVADGIIVMDIHTAKGIPRRTIAVRKMRGTSISLRPSSYKISDRGLVVFPVIQFEEKLGVTEKRVPTGIPGLDEMSEGGFLERSVTCVSGASGVGKTTFGLQFVYVGAEKYGEKGLFISFGESSDQIRVVAKRLGFNSLSGLEKKGKLKLLTLLPERFTPEGLILELQKQLQEFRPKRVFIDDFAAIDAICDNTEFYNTFKTISELVQHFGATQAISLTTDNMSAVSITGRNLSTVADNVLLFRYVEVEGLMERSLIALKMRGTAHENAIKRFRIGRGGVILEGSFKGYTGILSGNARRDIADFKAGESVIARSEELAREKRSERFAHRLRQSESKRGRHRQ